MIRIVFSLRLWFLSACLSAAPAHAVSIKYEARPLPGGLWAYDYQLSGDFDSGDTVTLHFPDPAYSQLHLTPPADWFYFDFGPAAPLDHLLNLGPNDAVSVVDLPFSVEFAWSESGTPGSQEFDVFRIADFSFVGPLHTVPAQAIAEPGSLLLLASALALLRRRKPAF